MNKLICAIFALILFAPTQAIWPDATRSYGNSDVSRHSSSVNSQRRSSEGHGPPGGSNRTIGSGHHRPVPRPPEYGYWSRKCIKQRGSSLTPWNHSKDCDHPAYSGGYYPGNFAPPYGYGRPVIIINNYDTRGHHRR